MNMQKRQLAWYLIFGGLTIILVTFIGKILVFIGNNPFLGLAIISVISGSIILTMESKGSI